MAKQIETRSRAENEASLIALGANTAGALISGGSIDNFKEGWALPTGAFGKAHFYKIRPFTMGIGNRASKHMAVAKCGLIDNPKYLMGIGNWPKCKRCAKAVNRG